MLQLFVKLLISVIIMKLKKFKITSSYLFALNVIYSPPHSGFEDILNFFNLKTLRTMRNEIYLLFLFKLVTNKTDDSFLLTNVSVKVLTVIIYKINICFVPHITPIIIYHEHLLFFYLLLITNIIL